MSKGFSIVLCTYNGQSRLELTLAHLAVLEIPANNFIELVFVDNASTDSTAAFANEIWQKLGTPFSLIIIKEKRQGKGYAVETGYDAAKYSYVLTVDDDNWLDPDYLVQALKIFEQNPDVGILQGRSTGVFEKAPPSWIEKYSRYFIIGSPIEMQGYFPVNNFFVWGAGMVIIRADWVYLRSIGFSFLTSKTPGKAAGEDNETAIALLMLGRKIYYSDKLRYKHFMPSDRVTWNKLKSTFKVMGYVSHYFLLYALSIDANKKKYLITDKIIKKNFGQLTYGLSDFTWKQHVCYWVKPLEEWYQLELAQHYAHHKWHRKLINKASDDIRHIHSWMIPLIDKYGANFEWPANMFKTQE